MAKRHAPDFSSTQCDLFERLVADGSSSKTSQASTRPTAVATLERCLLTSLDAASVYQPMGGRTPALVPALEGPSVGALWTRNMPVWRSGASVCSLSQILERGPLPRRYFLSSKACRGILRRAWRRGRDLPGGLLAALAARAFGNRLPRLFDRAGLLGRHRLPQLFQPESSAGGGMGTEFEADGGLIPAVAKTLTSSRGKSCANAEDLETYIPDAMTFNLRGREGGAQLEVDPDALVNMRAANGGSSRSYVAAYGGNDTSGPRDIAACLNAKGGASRMDFESETLIAHTLRGGGFDGSEDGTGRGTPIIPLRASGAGGANGIGVGYPGDPSLTLDTDGSAAIAFDTTQITSGENRCNPQAGDPCHPLSSTAHPPAYAYMEMRHGVAHQARSGAILQRVRSALGEEAFCEWAVGGLRRLQEAQVLRPIVHEQGVRQEAQARYEVGCRAPRSKTADPAWSVLAVWQGECIGRAPQGRQLPKQFASELGAHLSELPREGAQAASLVCGLWIASEGIGVLREALSALQEIRPPARHEDQPIHTTYEVRRLTPREAERLMGVPDDYTLIPYGSSVRADKITDDWIKYLLRDNPKGLTREDVAKLAADGPRYKALGNGFAVPEISWIGRQIEKADKARRDAA